MAHLRLDEAMILGLVEGITEYLPISSTGHLIIASALLGLNEPEETKRAVDAFLIVIQGGAILAVLGLYRARVRQMWRGLIGRDEVGRRLLTNLLVAFLPAAIVGVALDRAIDIEGLLFHPLPVLLALGLFGVLMLLIGPWQRRFFQGDATEDPSSMHSFVDIEHLTWRRALLVGALQCVAIWPGTSRSLMTIVGGMIAGMRPRQAAEFSFLLGLPTLGGACVYRAAKNLAGDGPNMFEQLGVLPLLIGIAVATLSAGVAIRWLVGFLGRHGVALFGWYRLGLTAVIAALLAAGVPLFGSGEATANDPAPTTIAPLTTDPGDVKTAPPAPAP